jgi:hypothetical protein
VTPILTLQIDGLVGVGALDEAVLVHQSLNDPLLGSVLPSCYHTVLGVEGNTAPFIHHLLFNTAS